MVWVLLGPLAPFLSEDLKLTASQKGLMVAVPLLGGALFRPIMGVLGDLLGGRRAGMLGLGLTLFPLLLGWRFARHLHDFYAVGILLGIAGASFAVALPLAGSWYPPERQGLAMGIAGAGNSGTLLATLFAPRLAQAFGWSKTFAVAMLPVFAVLVLFGLMAKNNPLRAAAKPRWRDYAAVLREPDTGWFCFFYSFYGAVLYVLGPLVISLIPAFGLGALGRSYVVNLIVFHFWGVIYSVLGALMAAVNLSTVQEVLNAGSFIGGFVGLEQSFLLGLASIFYSISMAVIPFLASRIVKGEAFGTIANVLINKIPLPSSLKP